MKLYDFERAPNARRVRMFAAEKGIDLEIITVDLGAKEQMEDGYKAVNARMQVPALLLDDGILITESVAICRYLDETNPQPVLFGAGALGKANVEMWHRRMELEGMQPTADAVRNSIEFFVNRAVAGPIDFAQIPALANRGLKRIDLFHGLMEERLADNHYIAGNDFSIADIAGLIAIDFGKLVKKRVDDGTPHLKRWYDEVSARPSAKS